MKFSTHKWREKVVKKSNGYLAFTFLPVFVRTKFDETLKGRSIDRGAGDRRKRTGGVGTTLTGSSGIDLGDGCKRQRGILPTRLCTHKRREQVVKKSNGHLAFTFLPAFMRAGLCHLFR